MKEIFEKIWQMALPYQDKRDDPGHAEVTLKFARYLVELENGDEDVIIPAIIMHDVGYSQLEKERRMKVFDKDLTDDQRKIVQMDHQNESVKLAAKLLQEVNYPDNLTKEILEIISQHDTRTGFISRNDGLVRDADKLWRTSKECFIAGEARRKAEEAKPKTDAPPAARKEPKPDEKSPREKIKESIHKEGYFYSETARRLATADLKGLNLKKPGKADKPETVPPAG